MRETPEKKRDYLLRCEPCGRFVSREEKLWHVEDIVHCDECFYTVLLAWESPGDKKGMYRSDAN